jgi:hypothetical protein
MKNPTTTTTEQAVTPERKVQLFQGAVLMRLHLQLDLGSITEDEASYLWDVNHTVNKAMQAVLESLERVTPR